MNNKQEWVYINDNPNLYGKTIDKNSSTLIKFDDGSVASYNDEWPFAIATHFLTTKIN